MRPYLAIVVDSFREALHSRVLWVVLVCITLLFMLLFPIYVGQQATTGLREDEIINRTALAQQLLAASEVENGKPSPARHVWDKLDEEARRAVETLAEPASGREGFNANNQLAQSLARQLEAPDWYDPAVFKGVRLRREGRELVSRLEKGELNDTEKKRLNRLALESAFPESISFSQATSASLGYLVFGPQQLPLTREQLKDALPPFIVVVTDYTFGIFGILAALLITAPIMPQLFEPGSLHLLLSKPISRWMLFLTKFFGGCAFALITAGYFAFLLWLFLGTRLAIWDSQVLAAIPVYTFVFAVYYSVTALAGLVFRNTIVSVVLGIVFWAFCFGLGIAQNGMQFFVVGQNRIQRLAIADKDILAIMPGPSPVPGAVFVLRQFHPEEEKWNDVYRSQEEGPEPFNQTFPDYGPYYDREHEQLVSLQRSMFRGTDTAVSVARRSPLWPRTRGAALPASAVGILMDRQSRVLAVGLDGIYRASKNVALAQEKPKMLGVTLPWGTSGTSFEKLSEGDWEFTTQPLMMAIDPTDDSLVLYARGQLAVWQLETTGKYTQRASRTLADETNSDMTVAIADKCVLLAAKSGQLQLFDAHSLEPRSELRPEGKNSPRQVRASPDGKQFAVLFTHGELWLVDATSGEATKARVPGQGTLSAIAYEPGGELLVAHDANRVSRADPVTGERDLVCKPRLSTAEGVYYFGVLPVYTILPKPGEMHRTMLYLLTGKEATTADTNRQLPADFAYVEPAKPWQPVWSGALFMAVMLAIGCAYMERMEF